MGQARLICCPSATRCVVDRDEEPPHPVGELASSEDDPGLGSSDLVGDHLVALAWVRRMRDPDPAVSGEPPHVPGIDSSNIRRLTLEADADESPAFVR